MTAPPDPRGGGLLLAFYGDDFTGSTDAMEALTLGGLPTVLFLRPPTDDEVGRFAGYRAVGLAGCCATCRSMAAPGADCPPSISQAPGTIAEKYGPHTPGTKTGAAPAATSGA